jgi:hypothetical protein
LAYENKKQLKAPKKDYDGDLPDSNEDWVMYVNRLHDQGLRDRRRYEFQWVVNLAYYLGYQYLVYNTQTNSLEVPRDFKQPLIINRIGSFIEARHAKVTKNRPVARVIPDTTDPEDIHAARNADKCLMHLHRKLGMDHQYDRGLMRTWICGTSFMETLWDPNSGDPIEEEVKSDDGMDLILDEDEGTIATEEIFIGEVSTRSLSCFEIIPASDTILDVWEQPWMMKRVHKPIAEWEEIFPHLRGKLKRQDKEELYTEHEKTVQRMSCPIFQGALSGRDAPRDSLNSMALGKVFLMKPNAQYPGGLCAIIVGDQLAKIDKFPNNFGKNVYPWVKFVEKEDGFHFWGQSTIERLIPIQRAYNRLKQQKAKNAALMANLKWLLPKGSQVAEDALNDEEGEIVEYNPAVPKPEAAMVAPMPNYVTELARELVVDFRDVGGQRESSVTPPPNVVAGVAMQTAAELADEIIGPIIKRIGTSMSLVANTQLELIDQEWQEPRLIKVIGDTGKIGILWLKGADLRHHTDVHIEIESMYPDFRGAKRQTLMDLWDRRIIVDPTSFLKAFRYGTFDVLMEEHERMDEAVELEIAMMKKGKMPEFNPMANHMLYIKKLSGFIQTPEFLQLIPERKQIFIQRLQIHTAALMGQLPGGGAAMAQQNQASVGTPFGAATPAGSEGGGV